MPLGPYEKRFICPRCTDPHRTTTTERSHAECEYCGEGMVPMVTWVRRQTRKNKPGRGPEKESS